MEEFENEHIEEIANKLDVSKDEVISMNRRLSERIFTKHSSWRRWR